MTAPFRAWPYAALAVVNWLYTTPSLFCWVVFRHPMDQDVKPPLAKWIVTVDGVPKAVVSSVWVDEWTLLLTITLNGVKPAVVYVEYDGPHADLQTTWGKQWEPWGPILATSFEVIPQNIIVMFHGAVVDIPPGWVLCNGFNGTPNLSNRFVLQTGVANPPGSTGGATTHDHTFTSVYHAHLVSPTLPFTLNRTNPNGKVAAENTQGTTDSTDGRPRYYTLAYIMKV